MKEVLLKHPTYRLYLGDVGFWVDVNGQAFLANPTDASYLAANHGTTVCHSDDGLEEKNQALSALWRKRVEPILNKVFSGFAPCSHRPKSAAYWDCAETPYFGVRVLHSDKFVGQYCGVFEQDAETFKRAMNEPRHPWAVTEIITYNYHFVGDANSDWQILLG